MSSLTYIKQIQAMGHCSWDVLV